jgi:quinol---cytochrome c reductase iron-sulfur subunit, bacillus type
MGNRSPIQARGPHGPIAEEAVRRARSRASEGLSRRTLLRRSLGAGIAVLGLETAAAFLGGWWPSAALGATRVRVGTLADLIGANPGIPVADGFPAYVSDARAFVLTLQPGRGWQPGEDPTGDGSALNVRVLSQVCPHLGCRPNPCVEDFWFHCPCHQSRYDGHGIKAAGLGPADRGMDRMAIEVDRDGVLTVFPNRITQGPQPVPLGAPGLIPPRVARGCGG